MVRAYLFRFESVWTYATNESISASDSLSLNAGILPFPLPMICWSCALVWLCTGADPRSGAFRLFPTAVGVPFGLWHVAQLPLNNVCPVWSWGAARTVPWNEEKSANNANKVPQQSVLIEFCWIFFIEHLSTLSKHLICHTSVTDQVGSSRLPRRALGGMPTPCPAIDTYRYCNPVLVAYFGREKLAAVTVASDTAMRALETGLLYLKC